MVQKIMVFTKNKKELETLLQTIRIYSQDIGKEFGIEKSVMLIMKKRRKEKDRTSKSEKCQNTKGKRKLQVPRNIGSGYYHTNRDESKSKKRVLQKNKKTSWNQTLQQKNHQRNKQLSSPSCKILWAIVEMNREGCPRGVMVKAMHCGIVVREFVLQSRYYVHFRANTLGKGMNPLILPPAMGK